MAGDREKALESGCTGYIEKPINPDTFMTQVEEYLLPESRRRHDYGTMLMIDDNGENRYLLEVLLKQNGFETVSATNGKEALDWRG